MHDIKVLITTYHQAYLVRGGGEFEMLSIAEGLRQVGVNTDIYGPYSRPLEFYDVVLHFSVDPGGLDLLRQIKASGKPVVLWPNLWLDKGNDVAIDSMRKHVDLADFVAFKSKTEHHHLTSWISVPAEKIVICKAVVDMCYLKPAPRSLFQELYGMQDYALGIGLVEPCKNQLAIIRVLREQNIPLVLVGKYRNQEYYEACREAGRNSVLFIDSLPQRSEIIRSALQNALFYVEISHDPAGLSSIEAALSGCRMLLGDSEWSREHFAEHAEYVDPFSDLEIAAGVKRVLQRSRNTSALQQHVLDYCFPKAIEPLTNVLKKVAG